MKISFGSFLVFALLYRYVRSLSRSPVREKSFSDKRRTMMLWPAATLLTASLSPIKSAEARGLVKFPCITPLANKYHLMRAGSSILQEEGIAWVILVDEAASHVLDYRYAHHQPTFSYRKSRLSCLPLIILMGNQLLLFDSESR